MDHSSNSLLKYVVRQLNKTIRTRFLKLIRGKLYVKTQLKKLERIYKMTYTGNN